LYCLSCCFVHCIVCLLFCPLNSLSCCFVHCGVQHIL
jgi:hypothetical protein